MIIYFEGGGDIKESILKKIDATAVSSIKEPSLLVIPWTTNEKIKLKKYNGIIKEYFKSLGVLKIRYLNYTDSKETIKKKFNKSNLVYLPGGDTAILVDKLKKKNIYHFLKNYRGVIIGNSAGAISLGTSSLKIVNFEIEPHYSAKNDSKLKKLSLKNKIYAVREDSSLVYYSKDKFKTLGVVYIFYKNKKKKL